MKTKLLILLIGIVFVGCRTNYREDLISGYSLGYSEEEIAMSLYVTIGVWKTEVVSSTVFATGYNKDFIMVKQHPRVFPSKPYKFKTNYFIVPLKNPIRHAKSNNIIGPLTESEFKIKRKDLGIPNELTFSIIFKNLE